MIKNTFAKVVFSSALSASLVFGLISEKNYFTNTVEASTKVNIVIDGKTQNFSNQPIIIQNITYIPIRAVSESLGSRVNWNNQQKMVEIIRNDVRVQFIVGSNSATINGIRQSMPQSKLIGNVTYVPLRFISENLGMRVDWNNTTKTVHISSGNSSNSSANQSSTKPTVTFITHRVVAGDNAWNLGIQYGVPMHEILKLNNLTTNSILFIGQALTIPQYNIPIKPVPGPQYGELLDWWTEAQYVFSIGKVATITDFQTGRTFRVQRTMGGNHADAEPLTAQDAEIMRQIWGGSFSWTPRAIIVEVDGRKLAAAMHSFPHEQQVIRNNNYNGHFCIHFLNSQRHSDSQVQASMQAQVRIAAGIK